MSVPQTSGVNYNVPPVVGMGVYQKCRACGTMQELTHEMNIGPRVLVKFVCKHVQPDTGEREQPIANIPTPAIPIESLALVPVNKELVTLVGDGNVYDAEFVGDSDTLQLVPYKAPETHPATREQVNWAKLYTFQKDGVLFLERTADGQGRIRALIADEPGLGKTAQVLTTLYRNRREMLPALIVVPAQLLYKWQREFATWFRGSMAEDLTPEEQLIGAPFIHFTTTPFLPVGRVFIISHAMLAKNVQNILEFGFKTLIVDESHNFKDPRSARTQALLTIERHFEHKIFMTATPVMNRPSEYWPALKAIRPQEWLKPDYILRYCAFANGKAIGIDQRYRQAFHSRISEYVIRRTKEEAVDLPKKHVWKKFVSLEYNANFVKAYNKQLEALEEILNNMRTKKASTTNLLGIISQIRHMVGIFKVPLIAEMAIEFLETHPGEKLAIACHHKLVMEELAKLLLAAGYKSAQISDQSPQEKDARQNEFRDNPDCNVLLLSIRGGGEGRDIQFCHNVIQAERDWNAAREVQLQDRFHRIGSTHSVDIAVVMVGKTIDEFFDAVVELKAGIFETMTDANSDIPTAYLRDIAMRAVQTRLKYAG